MASLIKTASADLSASQLVFFRSLVGLVIILPFVFMRGISRMKTHKIKLHLFRAFVSLCAMTCFFYAIANIGLAESTLLNASSPLFIAILATALLNEKLDLYSLFALPCGFIGVALILKPGTEFFNLAALAGLASGFFIASAKILVRYMSDTEPVLRTVFYFSLFSTVYSAIPMFWLWQEPGSRVIVIMILAGICATGGQTLLTYAFSHNEAIRVSPFTYVTVLLATLIGWIIWLELPDISSSVGAIMVIISCLIITFQRVLPNPWTQDSTNS